MRNADRLRTWKGDHHMDQKKDPEAKPFKGVRKER